MILLEFVKLYIISISTSDLRPKQGLFTAPNRFDCSITPRSDHHAMIIKRDFLDAIRVFEPFEHNLDAGDKIFVQEQRESVRSTME